MPLKLTPAAARDMKENETLHDAVVKGLQLRMRNGNKTWSVRYRKAGGGQRRYTIGKYPTITMEVARDIARGVLHDVAKGKDPAANKAAQRVAPTVAELVELYLSDAEIVDAVKARSFAEKRRHLEKQVLPLIGRMLVDDVTTSDVNRVISYVSKNGLRGRASPVGANRVQDSMSALFQYAERDVLKWRPPGSNPARGDDVKRNPEFLRDRHASIEELRDVAGALDGLEDEYPQRVIAIRCIIFCGSRISEMITARKDQFRGDRLVLKEHKTMRFGGRPRVIMFPKQAIAELALLPKSDSKLLFGRGLSVDLIDNVWNMARRKAGCPDLQLRDMRRTFGSAAKTAGRSLAQIGQIFNHGNPATTLRYAWLFESGLVGVVQDTANILAGHMDRDAPAKPTFRRVRWVRSDSRPAS